MEHDGLPGGMLSGVGSGMLGLEVPLVHRQQNPQNSQNEQNDPHNLQHPKMGAYTQVESDYHPQQSAKHAYPYASAKTGQQSPLSDEDAGDDSATDAKRKMSPWQRVKWTDSMVRLLIMAVYFVGDEMGTEGNDPAGRKKLGGLSQKKGKWKSVSRAMMEKGFYVSPQQCEDKFNDLNKRYKRVNEILGKGTACRVVENQSLLDSMDLSPKMKEEVRKLLNSKQLFFREMCAYHNSCGHSSTGVISGASQSPEAATDQFHVQPPQIPHQQQQHQLKSCSHSSENAEVVTNPRAETEGSKMGRRIYGEEDDEDDDESDEDDDDSDSDDDDEDEETREGRAQSRHGHEDEDDHDEKLSLKRPREEAFLSSALMQQLNEEMMTAMQDGAKSPWEKKQYIKLRLLQLEEQQVSYQYQAFELEKQRLKWAKFSSKKEREMDRAKLQNERRLLENEKMVLCAREMELLDLLHEQQQQQIVQTKGMNHLPSPDEM
ncbi:hypothetical protein K2173_018521 [Erythroxylum novogranatense]|uniref:Myb/SANT-like DNA-binding domain-containing protein n=1 Tax=Erythroxylum novogranatense TaxID=1862640 RepID=A0AAV8UE40_9ROSI|nr:hypothetical protein K2173_018521 [Erythroxylum novogranatense]